ncbi:MAG: hypothetical protein FWC19_09575 [Treponema sp.]|nr:hypothetical protein [Treponema sp.]MCL2273034.1 hypothetical protein [Treponema sp.]
MLFFFYLDALHKNFLLRGAIVHDKVCHEKGKIFGPALVKAYNIEKKIALYPRIVFSDDILDIEKQYPASWIDKSDRKNAMKNLISKDLDGLNYFNYFEIIKFLFGDNKEISYYDSLKNLINDLGKYENDMSLQSKYFWLKKKYCDYK